MRNDEAAVIESLKKSGSRLWVDERRWAAGWNINTLNGVPLSRPLAIKGRGTLVWIPDETERKTE